MPNSQKTPLGYDGHLIRAKVAGIKPMSPERWAEVCNEADRMPGTLELPDDALPTPPSGETPRS